MALATHAVSRESFARLSDRLPAITGGTDALALADDLFSVATLLSSESGLRRALTDPAMPAESRSALVRRLLASQVSAAALDVVVEAVSERWASPQDLGAAVEMLGLSCLLLAADADGSLPDVEDELFRFSRVVQAQADLSLALTDESIPAQRKRSVVESLLAGKARPLTVRLVERTVAERRGLTLERALDEVIDLAAARRQRSIARVTSAVPLGDAQVERLSAALTTAYGRALQLQLQVDPSIVGGLVVQVGDELIDGSVLRRLAAAQDQVAR